MAVPVVVNGAQVEHWAVRSRDMRVVADTLLLVLGHFHSASLPFCEQAEECYIAGRGGQLSRLAYRKLRNVIAGFVVDA
jgi:hypothetical protein